MSVVKNIKGNKRNNGEGLSIFDVRTEGYGIPLIADEYYTGGSYGPASPILKSITSGTNVTITENEYTLIISANQGASVTNTFLDAETIYVSANGFYDKDGVQLIGAGSSMGNLYTNLNDVFAAIQNGNIVNQNHIGTTYMPLTRIYVFPGFYEITQSFLFPEGHYRIELAKGADIKLSNNDNNSYLQMNGYGSKLEIVGHGSLYTSSADTTKFNYPYFKGSQYIIDPTIVNTGFWFIIRNTQGYHQSLLIDVDNILPMIEYETAIADNSCASNNCDYLGILVDCIIRTRLIGGEIEHYPAPFDIEINANVIKNLHIMHYKRCKGTIIYDLPSNVGVHQ